LKAAKKAALPPQPAKPKWPPLVETLLTKLDEAKAEAIVTIDLTGKSTVADTMVVASGRSNRHVDAIARQAIEELEKSGVKNIRSEGMPQCDWVLVDAGDILLHVFRPEVRSFYNLEKLWSAHAP
jgi:ribosome-associated protein